ncbi:MAG: hypothetical protein HQK53_14230 [Oligoflexia bacterium]|nr:hypothetical protein [Oligoflexia bacterium]
MKFLKTEKLKVSRKSFFTILFTTFLATRSIFCTAVYAAAATNTTETPVEYGTLYLVEQKEMPSFPWQVSASFGSEVGNPYERIYDISLMGQHSIGHYVWAGLQYSKFYSSHTTLTNQLLDELNLHGFGAKIKVPSQSLFAVATLVPFMGYSSFIGGKPLAMEIDFRVGAGCVFYKGDADRLALTYSLRPVVWVTRQVSVQFGIGHIYEFGSPKFWRFIGDLSTSVRF